MPSPNSAKVPIPFAYRNCLAPGLDALMIDITGQWQTMTSAELRMTRVVATQGHMTLQDIGIDGYRRPVLKRSCCRT